MAFLKTKDVLDLTELSTEEIYKVLSLATNLKAQGKDSLRTDLAAKAVGLIFNKPSTRTRVSFEVGVSQLGGTSIYLHSGDLQINRGESLADTAKVLSSYLDAIVIRTGPHNETELLAAYAGIPVINALTDLYHPCQSLADLMTVFESKHFLKGLKMAYLGDGNNVCHSLIIAAAKMGLSLSIATPAGFEPKEKVLKKVESGKWEVSAGTVPSTIGRGLSPKIEITNNPEKAAEDADILYTDVWVSMGQEQEAKERLGKFKPFQLNKSLIKLAKADAIIMHCLPAHRGQEISDEVMSSSQSVVFEQAENRLYTQKALLMGLIGAEDEDKV